MVVDRPAVVRVDQGEVPHLGALVEVGDARAGQQQRGLGQRVDPAPLDELVLGQERLQVGDELLVGEHAGHERGQRVVVVGVRVGPGGVHLGFLGRLLHERARPGPPRSARCPPASGRAGTRRCGPASRPACSSRCGGPSARPRGPMLGQLRQQADPGPHVAAALGVVGRQGEHRLRPVPRRVRHRPVEVRHRAAELARVAADLVEAGQRLIPVERGVLRPLGHHRRADLGEPHGELGLLGRAGVARRRAARRRSRAARRRGLGGAATRGLPRRPPAPGRPGWPDARGARTCGTR